MAASITKITDLPPVLTSWDIERGYFPKITFHSEETKREGKEEVKEEFKESKSEQKYRVTLHLKENSLYSYFFKSRADWLHQFLDQKDFPRGLTRLVYEYWAEDYMIGLPLKKTNMTIGEKIASAVFCLFSCFGSCYCPNDDLNRYLEEQNFEGIAKTFKVEGSLRSKIDCDFILHLARQKKIDPLNIIVQHSKIRSSVTWWSSRECNPNQNEFSVIDSPITVWKEKSSCPNGVAFINALNRGLFETKETRYTLLIAFLQHHSKNFIDFHLKYYCKDLYSWTMPPFDSHRCCYTRSTGIHALPYYLLKKYMLKSVEENDVHALQLFMKYGFGDIPSKFTCRYKGYFPFSHDYNEAFVDAHAMFHPKVSVVAVTFWLQQGISVNEVFNHKGNELTLLMFAIWRDDKPLIDFLLANGADKYFPCKINGAPVLPIVFAPLMKKIHSQFETSLYIS